MTDAPELFMLYVTFPTPDAARAAARALVEKKLAACVNIFSGAHSVYRWKNQVEETIEAVLIAKTSAAKRAAAEAEVKRLHSYDVPCIIAYPIAGGYLPFLQWVAEEVGSD